LTVELRDLRWAITASQHRSLRQAAETLNVRQSTLSRRLRDLEHRLGGVLFERSNGGTRPTAAGYEFLETARRIINETDGAFTRLRTRCRGENGALSIGIYTSFSAGNLRATIIEYQRRFPQVEITAVDGPRHRLLSELAADVLDVAIVTAEGSLWTDQTLRLWTERVVAALPEHHPLGAAGNLHWSDLRKDHLLFSQRDPGPEFLYLMLRRLGRPDDLQITQNEIGLDRLLSLVGAGVGSALVGEGATGAAYAGVIYREIHDESGCPMRLNFIACWRQTNSNPTLVPFLALLRERYPDLSVSSDDPTGA